MIPVLLICAESQCLLSITTDKYNHFMRKIKLNKTDSLI